MLSSKKHWDDMQQFLRIANARLRSTYKFGPQRRAVAAKMYSRWLEKKVNESNSRTKG
jgi:hypothetical protein